MRGFTLISLLAEARSDKGFTLIELLVVIAIMGILTIMVVPSYNEYSRNQKLADATGQLQSVLRQTQNNAQTGTICKIAGGATSKALYWYVDFMLNGTQYSLVPQCESGSQTFPPTLLPTGVTISNISIYPQNSTNGCSLATGQTLRVQFNNVTSNVLFNDLSSGCPDNTNSSLEITLSLTGSQSKIIRIEKGGGIYVKK